MAHKNMECYQHDLEKTAIGEHNCLNVDQAHLLLNGFNTRNGGVRGARSVSTAMQLVAVIFQAQSQGMFGGVGSAHIDYDLAPFVRMSFIKHFKDGLEFVDGNKAHTYKKFSSLYTDETINSASIIAKTNIFKSFSAKSYKYALAMLEKEGKQAAQGLYHNLNTLESRPEQQPGPVYGNVA